MSWRPQASTASAGLAGCDGEAIVLHCVTGLLTPPPPACPSPTRAAGCRDVTGLVRPLPASHPGKHTSMLCKVSQPPGAELWSPRGALVTHAGWVEGAVGSKDEKWFVNWAYPLPQHQRPCTLDRGADVH